jgi:hypothetical protein
VKIEASATFWILSVFQTKNRKENSKKAYVNVCLEPLRGSKDGGKLRSTKKASLQNPEKCSYEEKCFVASMRSKDKMT